MHRGPAGWVAPGHQLNAGMRVAELGRGIAVSYAGKLLLDQGAQVLKIDDGDPLRHWSAATPDEPVRGDGALWSFLQQGKRVVGADAAQDLDVDVVLTSTGFDGAAPVVVHVTSFGTDGPLAGTLANEFTLQAWCGLMSACGTKDTSPLPMGAGLGEWAAGATAALAAMAARRAGGSVTVDVAALDVMAVCLNNYPALYRDFTGNVAALSRGGDWPSVVRCKDGWVGLCLFTAQQWADFAAMAERPDLSEDERCLSMAARSRNRAFVESAIRPWLAEHTTADIVELGGLFRVPVAFIGTGESVFDLEHLVARGVFVDHPAGFRRPRSPIRRQADEPDVDVAVPSRRRPLEGVRVVDLTAFWAGPYTTHLLATLGADVIKVESPNRPDGMRFATVKAAGDDDWLEYGPTFPRHQPRQAFGDDRLLHHRGPSSAAAPGRDRRRRGRELHAARHGRDGLGYDQLRQVKPDLIMLRQPGFGLDGPWANHAAFAQTMEQTSGIAWLTGIPEGEPLVRSTIDPITGIHGAFAVVAALERRAATGRGELLEVPMIEVALNVAAEPVVTWSATGHRMDRQGARGPRAVPQGVYRCSDDGGSGSSTSTEQWVALAVETDEQWQALAELVGWGNDLATRADRRARHDEIDARLAVWFANRPRDVTADALLAAGIPAAPVWDQMRQDELPQLQAPRVQPDAAPIRSSARCSTRRPACGQRSST